MEKNLQPLVSVVITCYNKENYIGKAIEGALDQETKFNYEILIIDDCSTDKSWQVLKQYQSKNPKVIRLYKNRVNQGVTKTWVKVCKKARGKWIARIDGDDYWIDSYKLQQQIDLLAKHPKSKWCNTDFNTVNEKGEILYKNVFTSKTLPLPMSYEDLLVNKGFTMSSTWMVDTELINKINSTLDLTTVDDSFNIQLELFHNTQLVFLPVVTTVYNYLEGSVSHPDMEQYRRRSENLLATQKVFLRKYPQADFIKMLDMALERLKEWEITVYSQKIPYDQLLMERDQAIKETKQLRKEKNALQHNIQDLHRSTSWKITKPIRGIKRLLKS